MGKVEFVTRHKWPSLGLIISLPVVMAVFALIGLSLGGSSQRMTHGWVVLIYSIFSFVGTLLYWMSYNVSRLPKDKTLIVSRVIRNIDTMLLPLLLIFENFMFYRPDNPLFWMLGLTLACPRTVMLFFPENRFDLEETQYPFAYVRDLPLWLLYLLDLVIYLPPAINGKFILNPVGYIWIFSLVHLVSGVLYSVFYRKHPSFKHLFLVMSAADIFLAAITLFL